MQKIELAETDLESTEIVESIAYASMDGTYGLQQIERRVYWRLPDGRFVIEESFAYENEPPVVTNYYEATEWEFLKDVEWNCFERSH